MNKDNNTIVNGAEWIFGTIAKILVVLFDGIREAVEHATPSMFALVATLLPYALPLPVAFMTAHSAQTFFDWEPWAAWTLGIGLEGLGLLVWVRLVDAIVGASTITDEKYEKKVEDVVNLLWAVAIAYEIVLVLINVVLTAVEGASFWYAVTLLLVCSLPALSAFVYGLHRRDTIRTLATKERKAEEQREKERQERRQDRREAQELKLKYAADGGDTLKLKTFRNPRKPRVDDDEGKR